MKTFVVLCIAFFSIVGAIAVFLAAIYAEYQFRLQHLDSTGGVGFLGFLGGGILGLIGVILAHKILED